MTIIKILEGNNVADLVSSKGVTILWDHIPDISGVDSNIFSIPRLVEDQSDFLKARFLSLLQSFGQQKINGVGLTEYLEIRRGFSFWWMTSVFEKCNWNKSPHLFEIIKLMALEDLLKRYTIDEIIVYSSNQRLMQVLREWANQKKINFKEATKTKISISSFARNSLINSFPITYGFFWFIFYFFSRVSLRGVGLTEIDSLKATTTFFSYLFNPPDEFDSANIFGSQFWGPLPNLLAKKGIKANWIHLFVRDKKISSAKNAAKRIDKENFNSKDIAAHTTLDGFINQKVLIDTFKDWFLLLIKYQKLKKIKFRDERSTLDFTSYYQAEWRESIAGKSGLKNLLHFHLLGQAIKSLPSQALGLYLQENCPWESALIYLWKLNNNGKLIGVPHSTILFWDLRYFHDPRLLSCSTGSKIPLPDSIAVNGLGAMKEMIKGGYTQDRLIEVEALRYLYLNDTQCNQPHTVSKQIKMLVLCDYTITWTLNQLDALFDAIKRINFGIEVIIKPHPNCPIGPRNDIPKCCQIKYDPISELLKTCNVAYTTDATSASVEAYIKGLPIISVLNPSGFNLSPLRNFSDVVFIRNGLELSQALSSLYDIGIVKQESSCDNYFNLDNNLPKWKSIFNWGVK